MYNMWGTKGELQGYGTGPVVVVLDYVANKDTSRRSLTKYHIWHKCHYYQKQNVDQRSFKF